MQKSFFEKQWNSVDVNAASKQYDELWDYLPDDISSILDVGGGVGAVFESLKSSGRDFSKYTLVDSTKSAIFRAKERGVDALLHDLEEGQLPFEDDSFDCVFLIDVLEHLRNPWDVLAESARVSKKYVFVHGPNFAYWRCRLDALRGLPNRQMVTDKHGSVIDNNGNQASHIYFMTYTNLLYWGKKKGLSVEKKRVYWYRRYIPFRWFLEPLFGNWGSQYQIVFKKLD